MYHSYHFYNLTNSEAFLAGQPPVVEEVGPFTFEVRRHTHPFVFEYDRYMHFSSLIGISKAGA
jgi:hypothetical protein